MKYQGIWLCVLAMLCIFDVYALPTSARAEKAIERVSPRLSKELAERGRTLGTPVFIRIFKREAILELWLQGEGGRYSLFREYAICSFSGDIGPKTRQGDNQAPEGFYYVSANRLNPWSRFHLSMNLGYPNPYDRHYARTGSALMIHGNCVSIGCYAMTDPFIEEIYTLVHAAIDAGQSILRVHAFPFRMTQANMEQVQEHKWFSFWQNLQQGYNFFEEHHEPPNVELSQGQYVFEKLSQ